MAKRKLSKSEKRLNKAVRMQATQRKRIEKIMSEMERQGFYFSPSTWKSVRSEVTSNASNAMRKVKQLQKINKTALYNKAVGYVTDDWQVKTGKKGVKEGRRIERAKARQKRIVSGLDNIDELISSMVDYVIFKDGKKSKYDRTAMKQRVVNAWQQWKAAHQSYSNKDIQTINKLADLLEDLQTVSEETAEYDSKCQKIIVLLTGQSLNPDEINDDEEMEMTDVGAWNKSFAQRQIEKARKAKE